MYHPQLMLKEPLVNILKGEVRLCKKDKQKVLWVNWLYNEARLNFFDTYEQFETQGTQMYFKQGFTQHSESHRPEAAKSIGAKAVIMHVFRNPNYQSFIPSDPLGSLFGGYLNGHNEFCIYEVII